MELANEDALLLNVLLAAQPKAIRIDESSLTVYGLTDKGEAAIQLRPTCRNDQYLKRVRETLAEQVLDSPGGYPVYLRRWTRMGQTRDDSLEKLLLLGEPEAVTAVVHARGLTDEIARRVWWIMPTADNARRMLERDAVVQGGMGKVLVDFLVEHLPFEEENPAAILHTVRLVLHSGLCDETTRQRLWNRTRHNSAYTIGFLEFLPDQLPQPRPARADYEIHAARLAPLISDHNAYAQQLARVLSSTGQTFLHACEEALKRPSSQETATGLLNAIGNYFAPLRPAVECEASCSAIMNKAERLIKDAPPALQTVLDAAPELAPELRAMLALSLANAELIAPILARTTAIGSLLRTKLAPVFAPLQEQIGILQQRGNR